MTGWAAAVVLGTVLIAATAVGVIFLAERPSWTAFVALALILGGVALATLEPREKLPA